AAWRGVDLYAGNLHGPNIAEEGLPFTYTPFGALALWPTNLGSQHVGLWAWSIVSMLALVTVIAMVTPPEVRHRWVVVFGIASVACATIMVYAHFFFGQINILLMLLVVADLTRRDDTATGRRVPRGVLIGLAAAIKLTPGLFIVYLAVARQWRMFWWSVASCIGAFVVAFLIRPSLTIAFFTHGLWHLADKVALGTKFATSGNNSIQGVLAAVGDWTRPLAFVLSAVAAVVGLLLARRAATRSGLLAGGLIVGMTATLISPISWVHHWVYLVPAAVFIWFHRGWWARAVVVIGTSVTVLATPEVGQDWLVDASAVETIIGWALREMLMLLGILAIAIIAYGKEKPLRAPSDKVGTEVEEPVRA
ncbi:MAG TPA: glycosyltransferase family 87 protein, partial [Mycobacterium sp.]|nr:glycosyltransferase family 87 protein [Mycobacterium sp.]